jgi:AraC-like DNA-binding protein
MNLSIARHNPSFKLASFVETYWYGTFNLNNDLSFNQRVVPNGCIELIIHMSDDHCALNKSGDAYCKSPPFTLLGVYLKPYLVKFATQVNALGVRFYPDGVRNILGIPPGKFLSTYEDGTDVVGKDLYEFCCRVREVHSVDKKIKMTDDFFISQLIKNQREYDNTHLAMQLIRKKQGVIDFKELTEKIPVSLRQLQREFKDNYGLKITDYIRLSRLNAINKYMMVRQSDFTELAYDLDFTDQSHFIREFKNFVGVAPKKFVRSKANYIINAV